MGRVSSSVAGWLVRFARAPRVARTGWLLLAGGGFGVVAALLWLNRATVAETVARGDYRWLVVVLLVYLAAMGSAILGWHRICRELAISRGVRRDATYYALSTIAGRLPGGIWGLAARVYLYRSATVGARLAAAAWVVEQVVTVVAGLAVLVIWLVLGTLLDGGSSLLPSVALALVVGGAAVIAARRAIAQRWREADPVGAGGARRFPAARRWLSWIAVYTLVWTLGGLMLFATLRAFVALPVRALPVVEVAWIGSRTIALVVAILPSGLGLTEATLAVMLTTIVAAPVAATVAILVRLLTTLGEALVAGFFVAWDEARRVRRGPGRSVLRSSAARRIAMIEFRTSRRSAGAGRGYEEIYATEPIRHVDSFYRWALDLAATRPGDRVLDVSCGVGRVVDLAARRGLKAVGLDVALTALRRGRQAGARGAFVAGDAEALPLATASFDRVINLGSLEHYERPERGVAEMARVLRPGGRAVILVPNAFSYLHVMHVWRTGTVYDDGQPLQRYATRAAWTRLLEASGLRVRQIRKYHRVPPRSLVDLWWYLRQPHALLQLLATPFVPIDAASCFVFICERPETTNSLSV